MVEDLKALVEDAGLWAYAVLFAIALLDSIVPLVPSETLVIVGGVLAADGTLDWSLVGAAAALGAWAGDNLAYGVGRFSGGWLEPRLTRTPKRRSKYEWAANQLARRGGMLLVTARFVPGGRTAVTLSSGITRQPWRGRFVPFTALAAVVWALYASSLGKVGGERFEDNHTMAFVVAFAMALSVAVGVEVTRHLLRKRLERRLGHEG